MTTDRMGKSTTPNRKSGLGLTGSGGMVTIFNELQKREKALQLVIPKRVRGAGRSARKRARRGRSTAGIAQRTAGPTRNLD